jgi:hypothetical protein
VALALMRPGSETIMPADKSKKVETRATMRERLPRRDLTELPSCVTCNIIFLPDCGSEDVGLSA